MKFASLFLAILLTSCIPMVQQEEKTNPEETFLSSGAMRIGSSNAPVTLLLFTEYHCEYCREFQKDHFPKLTSDFITPGKLRIETVIFPLEKYPESKNAARALLCSASQNKGLEMHEILFDRIGAERIDPRFYAEEMELDMEAYDSCIESEEIENILIEQKNFAESLEVSLVPTMFINGEKIVGLPFYPDLRGMIVEKLK